MFHQVPGDCVVLCVSVLCTMDSKMAFRCPWYMASTYTQQQHTYIYIQNDIWLTVNNDFAHTWCDSMMVFTCDAVSSKIISESPLSNDKNRFSRQAICHSICCTLLLGLNHGESTTSLIKQLLCNCWFRWIRRLLYFDVIQTDIYVVTSLWSIALRTFLKTHRCNGYRALLSVAKLIVTHYLSGKIHVFVTR